MDRKRTPVEEILATREYMCKKEKCEICPALYTGNGQKSYCALRYTAYVLLGLEKRGIR